MEISPQRLSLKDSLLAIPTNQNRKIMEKIDLGGKTANQKSAYQDLKAGYTIKVGHIEMFIYTCERWGSPSYGKDYIACEGAGSWSIRVNYRDFADQIRREYKFEGTYSYSREY